MTREQIESLNLGITLDATSEIIINSGLEWLSENTTIDMNNLPSCAKLFLIKFSEIQNMPTGVSSESIEGLSQSFDTSNKAEMIWQIADSLLSPYLKGLVRFVPSTKKWV